jgi:flagellar hook protein FlgE
MLRSMFAGVSGMRNHQIRMDAIGNNIANVNTVGYKSSRVTFQDTLSQTIRAATAPQRERGGMNAFQIGLGMSVASVDVLHTLGGGAERYYTRAGMFTLERDGRLVYPSNGMLLMGWMADDEGVIDTNQPLTGITLPIGTTIAPTATREMIFTANLDASINGSLTYEPSPFTVVDGLGNEAQVTVTLIPTGHFNQWEYRLSVTGGTIAGTDTGTITIDEDGNISGGADFDVVIDGGGTVTVTFPAGADNSFRHRQLHPGANHHLLCGDLRLPGERSPSDHHL